MPHPFLDASCRVALKAFLHDLRKFAERAWLGGALERLDAHRTQDRPHHEAGVRGWHSHRRAPHIVLARKLVS